MATPTPRMFLIWSALPETLIVSDGFSCREQIFQSTGRRKCHFAEAILRATKSPSANSA
jgi:hypothetical protein